MSDIVEKIKFVMEKTWHIAFWLEVTKSITELIKKLLPFLETRLQKRTKHDQELFKKFLNYLPEETFADLISRLGIALVHREFLQIASTYLYRVDHDEFRSLRMRSHHRAFESTFRKAILEFKKGSGPSKMDSNIYDFFPELKQKGSPEFYKSFDELSSLTIEAEKKYKIFVRIGKRMYFP